MAGRPSVHAGVPKEGLKPPRADGQRIPRPAVGSYSEGTDDRQVLCSCEVPEEGLEPSHPCGQRILSPPRLPFRHSGAFANLPGVTRGCQGESALNRCLQPVGIRGEAVFRSPHHVGGHYLCGQCRGGECRAADGGQSDDAQEARPHAKVTLRRRRRGGWALRPGGLHSPSASSRSAQPVSIQRVDPRGVPSR